MSAGRLFIFACMAVAASAMNIDVPRLRNQTFCDIVEANGFPCLTYDNVTTKDGYILTMFRIPYSANATLVERSSPKPVVLLYHGLLDCAVTWIINPPEESLAFQLSLAGFDVWLGNLRGTYFSLRHVSYNTDDPKFWDFSVDEFIRYDVPASIDYALAISGASSLTYIGHSQGTIQLLLAPTYDPSIAQKVNLFVALAPVYTVPNFASSARFFSKFPSLLRWFGSDSFMQRSPTSVAVGTYICDHTPAGCRAFLKAFYGDSKIQDDRQVIVAALEPGGASTKTIVHWTQVYEKNKVTMFDYGSDQENMQHYNSTSPPEYSLSVFPKNIPIIVFWGGNDVLTTPTDTRQLLNRLQDQVIAQYYLADYGHVDFVWAVDARERIYSKIIWHMKSFQNGH